MIKRFVCYSSDLMNLDCIHKTSITLLKGFDQLIIERHFLNLLVTSKKAYDLCHQQQLIILISSTLNRYWQCFIYLFALLGNVNFLLTERPIFLEVSLHYRFNSYCFVNFLAFCVFKMQLLGNTCC